MAPFSHHPEPALFLSSISIGLNMVLSQAFVAFRYCCSLSTNPTRSLVCYDTCLEQLNDSSRYEIEAEASRFTSYAQTAAFIPAILSCFPLAVWSDTFGRKFPLIITLLGLFLQNAASLALSTFQFLPLWILLVVNVAAGFSGLFMMFLNCCFSMVADTVKDQDALTIKFGIANSLINFGVLVGNLLAGEIPKYAGRTFVYPYLIALFSSTLSFLYAVLILRDNVRTGSQNSSDTDLVTDDNVQVLKSNFTCSYAETVRRFAKVLTLKRPGRNRLYLLVAIVCYLFTYACDAGLPGLLFLLLSNTPFNYTEADFSRQIAVQTCASAMGSLLLPFVFKRYLKLTDDLWLIIVGVFVTMIRSFLFAFSNRSWMILVASLSYFVSTILFTGYRTVCSKLVHHSETARLFAVLSSVELIAPILSSSFGLLYSFSVSFFAGLTWIIAGAMLFVVLLAVCWFHIDKRTNLSLDKDMSATLSDDPW